MTNKARQGFGAVLRRGPKLDQGIRNKYNRGWMLKLKRCRWVC